MFMKKFKLLFLIIFLLVIEKKVAAQQIEVVVQGMVCSFCAQGIKKKFSQNPNVEKITVDLGAKKVSILTKKNSDLSDIEITKIINDAGYTIGNIKRTNE